MHMAKRANRSKKQRKRTPQEIEEEQSRTLYVRLPHTIKNVDEIKNLFFGDFKIKLPRQSSRYCHLIFTDLEDKIKNLKAAKEKLIDEKHIYVGPPKPMNLEKKKKPKQKKVVIPEPKEAPKIKKYIFVSNIAPGVKASEIKDAFPGAVTVGLMKGLVNGKKQAKVKMSSAQLCLDYVKNKGDWPVLKDHKVSVCLSKNSKNKIRKQKKTETEPLKIYDGESEKKDQSEVKDSDSKVVDKEESDEDEVEDNEEEEEDDEDNEEDEEDEEDEDEEGEEEESPSEEE